MESILTDWQNDLPFWARHHTLAILYTPFIYVYLRNLGRSLLAVSTTPPLLKLPPRRSLRILPSLCCNFAVHLDGKQAASRSSFCPKHYTTTVCVYIYIYSWRLSVFLLLLVSGVAQPCLLYGETQIKGVQTDLTSL